jgi:hypothetical protein
MTPKLKEDNQFAKWFRDWMAVIQRSRASVGHRSSEKTANVDGQEHFNDAHLFGPKGRNASGRDFA